MIRFTAILIFLTLGVYSHAQQRLPRLQVPQELSDSSTFKAKFQSSFELGLVNLSKVPNLHLPNMFSGMRGLEIGLAQQKTIEIEHIELPLNRHKKGIGYTLLFDPYLFADKMLEQPAVDD